MWLFEKQLQKIFLSINLEKGQELVWREWLSGL